MEREQIERAIAALEAQRLVLGDEVVDTMLAAARDKLRALDAAHPTDDRRRQATILFADLAGFTALSERLDPELAHDLMNALWRRLDAVIVRHGAQTIIGAAHRGLVVGETEAHLPGFADLVAGTQSEFIGIAPVWFEGGGVGLGSAAGNGVGYDFVVVKYDVQIVKFRVFCPSHITKYIPFW